MTKKKTAFRAFLMSLIALIGCVAMFAGATFAWFTSTATNSGNKITAGTLKVDLELLDEESGKWSSVSGDAAPIFEETNFEPGYTAMRILRVVNKGSLDLRWKTQITTEDELSELADVIDVYVKVGATEYADTLDGWTKAGTVREFIANAETVTVGVLFANDTKDANAPLGLALHMQESAGNDYQGMDLGGDIDITIQATQLNENAVFAGESEPVERPATATEAVTLSTAASSPAAVEVTVPAAVMNSLPAEVTSVALKHSTPVVDAANDTVTFDYVELVDQSGKIINLDDNTTPLTVKLPVSTIADGTLVRIMHDGVAVGSATVTEGYITYTVAHLCEIGVVGVMSKDEVANASVIKTAEELTAALTNGGDNYVLGASIALDTDAAIQVPAGKSVTIDLLGFTVSAEADTIIPANDSICEAVDVRGTLNISNGTLTYKYTGTDFGWSKGVEFFYVGFGGALNLDGVTVENLGGSSMAYCVDMVNSTGLTFTANNCVLKSTYIPVRVFNNGSGVNNVTITDSKLSGKYAFWVHIYSNVDNGNKGTKDATLNLDIFNGTNEFVGTAKPATPVLYGFTDVLFLNADGEIQFVEIETAGGLNDAIANETPAKLINNLTLTDTSIVIPAGKTVSIDLNGKTVSGTYNAANATCLIDNKGTLTLANGTVTYLSTQPDAAFGYGTNTINNSGSLVIDGADIINNTDGGSSNAIDNAPGSTLVIEDGTIEAKKIAIRIRDNATVTINGGEVIGNRAIQLHLFQKVDAPTTLTINGGTFTSTDDVYNLSLYSTASSGSTFAKTTVNINGGVFNGNVSFGGGDKTAQETVNITAGTFNGYVGRYLANDGWEDIVTP